MNRTPVIVDCETTGLDPSCHQAWEIAMIGRGTGARWLYRIEPDLTTADPRALEIGRFAERTAQMRHATDPDPGALNIWDLTGTRRNLWSDPADLAEFLATYLLDVILVAANPAFDAGFISALLAAHGYNPQPWHYRLRDIGSMAYGYLAARRELGLYFGEIPPVDAGTDDYARALGVAPEKFDRHSALGDCRLVAAMLDVVDGGLRATEGAPDGQR